jgi:predicted DNA-binding transcriptional regulator AlpA
MAQSRGHMGDMRPADLRALLHFDGLPDVARVRLPVVLALFGVSPVTVWRWCKRGQLPQPSKINGITVWQVGELRRFLTAEDGSKEGP